MARPRSISDARLLDAAGVVIGRRGPGFTMAQVAAEAGVAVGTLSQRFGSKTGLLQAISRHGTEAVVASMRERAAATDEPVEGLRAALVATYAGLGDAATAANHLAQLGVDLGDESLRELLGAHFSALEAQVRRLIRAAAHDLPNAPGVVRAARTLLAVVNGVALDWSIRPKGRLADRLAQDVDAVLAAWQNLEEK